MAVGFPHLWGWWAAGAFKAWPLFKSRSKNTPLSLTWEPQLSSSVREILVDPTIPGRVRQFGFNGTSSQLAHFLRAFDSSPPSNVSSIRLQISPHDDREPRKRLTRLLSSSYPKLSQLHLEGFLPEYTSPIFSTSSLTSLTLSFPDRGTGDQYTIPQFSRILQQDPNLQELDLSSSAMPLPEPSNASDPLILPRLATLRLYGTEAAISGFIDIIGVSSPLHNVAIRFERDPEPTIGALVDSAEKILKAYYGHRGLDYRKINRPDISYSSEESYTVFDIRSHSVPTPDLKSDLEIRFDESNILARDKLMDGAFHILLLDDVQEFAAEGLVIYRGEYRQIFGKMKDCLHLRLDNLDIHPVLEALSPSYYGTFGVLTEAMSL